jgi:hypothetical protein
MSDQEDFKLSDLAKPKSDQLNADDLIGGPITVTITRVRKGDSEQPTWIFYEGDNGKPYKSCKSMTRLMLEIWGDSAKSLVGKSMTLFRDPTVRFGPGEVGGIRISHMSHIDKPRTVVLTTSKTSRKPYTVKPLVVQQQSQERPAKERGNFDSAKVALASASAATVDAIMAVIEEKAWTKNERAEITRLSEEAKTRET